MLPKCKKIVSLLICVAMLLAFSFQIQLPVAAAAEGTCGDGVTWKLDDDGLLTISGSGAMKNYLNPKEIPWYPYLQDIKTIIIGDGITNIGDRTFLDCAGLTQITIGANVSRIGHYAFQGCTGLTEIVIPQSVTNIGIYAFQGCNHLGRITIPENVTAIGNDTFYGCTRLTQVTLSEKVTSIGSHAFFNCIRLSEINIPDSVTSIGDQAFYSCSSLTQITIPAGATHIGSEAFKHCSGLTEITIPQGVTAIGTSWFEGCTGLTKVNFHDRVAEIGNYAFSGCTGLKTIQFLGSAPSIGTLSFYQVTATAFHPCNDATWTDGVKENCGDSLTWIAHIPDENHVCTICGNKIEMTLSGTITNFYEGTVTLTLIGNGVEETLLTDTGRYSFTVTPGEYILTVEQENHVSRQYAVTVEDDAVTLDVKIHLIGDVDGNGKVNVGDISKINAHLKGTSTITDAYQLLCANVNGGSLNMGDSAALYSHIKGTKMIY